MAVQVTPSGTRGGRMSSRAARFFNSLGNRFYRVGLKSPNTVMLTSKGARTGQERSVTVRRFNEDGGAILVVGSKGGSATHPAWFLNLAKHPEAVWIDVDGERVKVTPTSLHGAERDQVWKRIVTEASNFGAYETKTDRQIPVVRLTPER